jgi:hypothetical protein
VDYANSTQAHALADRFGARALTVGRDIYFGRSEYAPGTHEGVRLLAHEIAHVVQEDAAPGWAISKFIGSSSERAGSRWQHQMR